MPLSERFFTAQQPPKTGPVATTQARPHHHCLSRAPSHLQNCHENYCLSASGSLRLSLSLSLSSVALSGGIWLGGRRVSAWTVAWAWAMGFGLDSGGYLSLSGWCLEIPTWAGVRCGIRSTARERNRERSSIAAMSILNKLLLTHIFHQQKSIKPQ
jgi:hypothetical protein